MPDHAHAPKDEIERDKAPLGRITRFWMRFLHVEAASGIVLFLATCLVLVLSNSPAAAAVHHFWMTPLGIEAASIHLRLPLELWINDGLMAIFFFLVGLEVKRELVLGELREVRRAMLPIVAAVGGMVAPAGIYLCLQYGTPGAVGWGIPMATDIAFVVGCMALLGPRIPRGLRVMLLSLAIVDDIGAILVIAIGYSSGIRFGWLACGLGGLLVVYGLLKRRGRRRAVYAILAALVWYSFLQSGVHATIAGVILGLMTPARSQQPDSLSPLEYLEARLHPWVAFGIMPVFALANAGVELRLSEFNVVTAAAVTLGLLLGKPLGITLASFLAVRTGLAVLPARVGWPMIAAGGALSGIGFTMALFIAGLALPESLLPTGKAGVLLGSVLSAILGMALVLLLAPTHAIETSGHNAGEECAASEE